MQGCSCVSADMRQKFCCQFISRMGLRIQVLLLCVSIHVFIIAAETNTNDFAAVTSLKDIWENYPPNWVGNDPCGSKWVGIGCDDSRVTSITLSSMGLSGTLSGDITALSELQILDLSYNNDMRGSLPQKIGNLKKLKSFVLVGCNFIGPIPDSIGSLEQLVFLSLNSNGFTGSIPPSIGNLSNLVWLDLTDNQLEGTIPVSNENSPGLDMLLHTKHFHLGKNKLSGSIPEKLFNSSMELIHVLFDNNHLTGNLPFSLGLVTALEDIRFDRNLLSGDIPTSLSNLANVNQLVLSNNQLTGLIPDLTGLSHLSYLDMSNNSFIASEVPSWISTLNSLTTLMMENTQLQGEVLSDLFSLPNLQTVNLKRNRLNGSLDIGTSHSSQLQKIDMQGNWITGYTETKGIDNIDTILMDNPICLEGSGETKSYCTIPKANASYSTPHKNCLPTRCSSNQISSPTCHCSYPYTGTIVFRSLSFSDLGNATYYETLQMSMTNYFQSQQLPVDSVSLSNPFKDPNEYLDLTLQLFPSVGERFNRTGVFSLGFVLSNPTYKPPDEFGSYYFIPDQYQFFTGGSSSPKSVNIGIIIAAAAGGCILLLLLLLAGVYAYRQKRRAHWDQNKSSGSIPQLKGARRFSFKEVKKCTNNFSEANYVGCGGYGKVYKGTLPTGELVAIKRAQQGSRQGGQEFKTEIELLSRVHHKNLVGFYGFCFERGEQMLIYEYVPNGSLRDSLSGKTGIRLDWLRRLKIALGAARGLAYLHELANPPIIHRDITSSNILLDQRLNAKVADFGLSKPMTDSDKGHVSTQVKGTMGYVDPEYYMTQHLTEKSDIYSFGVLMLELLTGRQPIERGKNVVTEMRTAIDKNKDPYNLYELLDLSLGLGTTLKGFDKFVDVAMKCVEQPRADRPKMSEVVKELENILHLAGLNPNAESASTSASYSEVSKETVRHPYGKDRSFEYSGNFPPSKIEPQ